MMRTLALLVLFFQSCLLYGKDGFVYLSGKQPLFYITDNEVYTGDKQQQLYTVKGNIFFTGGTDDRQSIFLLATTMNTAEEKLNYLYPKDSREPVLTYNNNTFSNGKRNEEELASNLLVYCQKSGKWMAFYSGINDSLLAYYTYDSLPAFVNVITAYTLINKYNLAAELQKTKPLAESPQFSVIKPVWVNIIDNEWVWDGKILRLRWNNDPRFFWTFDGQIIKPLYNNNINFQYQWDGEYFKPLWRTSRNEEWVWDGRQIKPVWSTDWATQYVIENNIIKPWSNVHSDREWRIDGSIPIPIIILIISGLARSG